MANNKSIDGIDIKEFARQKRLVAEHATEQVALKIEQIKLLIIEIKELQELSGVPCNIEGELNKTIYGWNSSSDYC